MTENINEDPTSEDTTKPIPIINNLNHPQSNKRLNKILFENYPLPSKPTRCQKLKYEFLCPPHVHVGLFLSLTLIFLLFYGALWGLVGEEALPNGNFFSILVVFLSANILGFLSKQMKLPPLFGMLVAGFALRNIPHLNIYENLSKNWSQSLRVIALVVILSRAGLGLDPMALKRLSLTVIKLAFTPCLVETMFGAITGHYLLNLPWIYSIMLGFILSAVSPAVVVPCLLQLNAAGYGVDEGIPTLIIAASSIDDILAITGFTIVSGIAFAENSLALASIKVPIEAIAGAVCGILFGVIFWFLPAVDMKNKRFYRFVVLILIGFLSMFGGARLHCNGFGPIAVLVVAFVAQLRWRKKKKVPTATLR